jgi:tetratricopeptide (TPR) repeat protein
VGTGILYVHQRTAIEAIVDGRLEQAWMLVERFVKRADELGAALRGRYFRILMLFSTARYLGRAEDWLIAYQDYPSIAGPASRGRGILCLRAVCLAQLGRFEEAQALVGPHLDDFERSSDDEIWMVGLVMLLEAAIAVKHQGAARALLERLACMADLSIGDWFFTCLARHLGDAALLLEDRRGARAYHEQALDAASKIGFRPELALTHVRVAELPLEDGNQSEAMAHLRIALPELQAMQMQHVT